MPERYKSIKHGLIKRAMNKGEKLSTAAAKIYNASRKPGEKPVARKHDSGGY
jgi:hypothetical protein